MRQSTSASLSHDAEATLLAQFFHRTSFIAYIKAVAPWFTLEEIHHLVAFYFEKVADGQIDRLMLSMGPRGSKSSMSSIFLPSWWMGNHRSDQIMAVGYKMDLPRKFSRQVMGIMRSREYKAIFPGVQLSKDAHAVGYWNVEDINEQYGNIFKRGEYQAAGVTSGIAGTGFNLGIVDDPLALEIDTPIPTPRGFIALGDLQVGDEVYGPDGKPTKVVAKSPIFRGRPLFRLTSSDGQSVFSDGGHWCPYMSDTNLSKAVVRLGKARDLAKWAKSSLPCLPPYAAVEYPACTLPIDPYVLGAWLGNGTASLGRMSCHLDDVAYMRAQFEAAGYETTGQADPHNFGVLGLRSHLILAGLLDNKHVPDVYLTASVAQRLALLQGFMDTDGCVSKQGQCSFSSINIQLAQSVQELVHSLGAKAVLTERPRQERDDGKQIWAAGLDYVVTFRLPGAARNPRKGARDLEPSRKARSFKITPLDGVGDVQCITVERDDGLFLCGRGYLVTHNSEQDKDSKVAKDRVWEWWGPGFYTRRQPERNAIILIMTRWAIDDLAGRLLEASRSGGDKWEVVNIPAILNGDSAKKIYQIAKRYPMIDYKTGEATAIELKEGDSFCPRRITSKELLRSKANMPERDWNALYMGNPSEEEGQIIKRAWWRLWPHKDVPECIEVISFYDTAFEAHEKADYSAMTMWGIFEHKDCEGRPMLNAILLHSWKRRVESPDLPRIITAFQVGTKAMYPRREDAEERRRVNLLCGFGEDENVPAFGADTILIENKGSGITAIKELRRQKTFRLPVRDWNPPRGDGGKEKGKYARAQFAAWTFEAGSIWYPDRRDAERVIDEVAKCRFDGTDESDDLPDTVVMMATFMRQRYKVERVSDIDEDEEDEAAAKIKKRRGYGVTG